MWQNSYDKTLVIRRLSFPHRQLRLFDYLDTRDGLSFIYVRATSLSDPIKVMAGEVWLLPISLNFDAYDYDIVLRSKTVWNWGC